MRTQTSKSQGNAKAEPVSSQQSKSCIPHNLYPIMQLQQKVGNQAVQRLLLSRQIQAQLIVGQPNDIYEQEADRVADHVMRMPDPIETEQGYNNVLKQSPVIQRLCPECGEEEKSLQAKEMPDQSPAVSNELESTINSLRGGGQPLSAGDLSFFEPRFGQDFSRVRIHTDTEAANVARSINARAFTLGENVVFGSGEYSSGTGKGRHLLAHELTHVVQQGASQEIQRQPEHEYGESHVHSNELHMGIAGHMVQRWPGDCDWGTYLVLRGSVETAKAVVSTLGACRVGDSCVFLATKIAAITAEIAARVALDTACFRGGDEGHRRQVQDKINMMNRCYRFFNASGCPPALIAAMAVVVERAREVIAAAAMVVAVALVVALIVAIIALVEVIASLIAAAAAATAEAAAAAAAVAAIVALLVLIKDELSPEESSSA